MKNLKRYFPFILVLIPLVVLILAIIVKDAIGPYWLGANSDPRKIGEIFPEQDTLPRYPFQLTDS